MYLASAGDRLLALQFLHEEVLEDRGKPRVHPSLALELMSATIDVGFFTGGPRLVKF